MENGKSQGIVREIEKIIVAILRPYEDVVTGVPAKLGWVICWYCCAS